MKDFSPTGQPTANIDCGTVSFYSTVVSIPEPSTLLALLPGLGALAGLLLFRKFA